MWKCRKCGKAVYFAERKSSLGYDWHPECLKCEECKKTLNPGLHAEHKGTPYCNIPCYQILFGPQLYGHGSQVESHSSFGQKSNDNQNDTMQQGIEKSFLESKIREYNEYYEGKSPVNVVKVRKVNGNYVIEGQLKIYWDISNQLILKEENDDRILVTRKLGSGVRRRYENRSSTLSRNRSNVNKVSNDDDNNEIGRSYCTLPTKGLRRRQFEKQENDKKEDSTDSQQSLTSSTDSDTISSNVSDSLTSSVESDVMSSSVSDLESSFESSKSIDSDIEKKEKTKRGLRRSNATIKRRCSINGHYYNRETCVFTPAQGSITSVWLSSHVNTIDVINLLLDKFKVTNQPQDFSLFIIRDNGECRRMHDDDYPLLQRILLGPDENAARVFILNKNRVEVSNDVAQYLNFSKVELEVFLTKFEEEEKREIDRIKTRFDEARHFIEALIEEHQLKLKFDSEKVKKSDQIIEDQAPFICGS